MVLPLQKISREGGVHQCQCISADHDRKCCNQPVVGIGCCKCDVLTDDIICFKITGGLQNIINKLMVCNICLNIAVKKGESCRVFLGGGKMEHAVFDKSII